MTQTTTKYLAFIGATGGCAGFALASALNAGYTCTALARTPEKLTTSLEGRGVDKSTISEHLTIIQGDGTSVEDVKKVLRAPNGEVVDIIINGIGGVPALKWSIRRPVVLAVPNICQDSGVAVLEAAKQVAGEKLPLLVCVSTTGIPPPGQPRDVPLAFVPLYSWLLHDPHVDKEVLERNLRAHIQLPQSQRGIRAFVLVKPSLLLDGDGLGLENVREGHDAEPAVGYTIQRKDVGTWIFERLIRTEPKDVWINGSATLTY